VTSSRRPLQRLPKAHLHVHLESTIRWTTLRELADRNGLPTPARSVGFDGFRAFGDHNSLIRHCLRSPEDFARVTRELCEDEAADGTRYLEVTFTAAAHGERLGAREMPLEAVLAGLAEGRAAHGIECRVILDHSRRRSVDRAWQTLALARRYAADGVVAFGLAGDETHPLAPFADVITAAAEAGVRLVHHAGEHAGPASIREAIALGRAERLGHGITVLDDAELVAEVRARRIPLEVCPSSNVLLGLVPSLAAHPLPRLLDAGLVVTLNTDIPALTGASLSEEYARVADAFGFDDDVLADLARAGVDASFAPPAVKTGLRAGIEAWRTGPR
jgi:adenosine deaminase